MEFRVRFPRTLAVRRILMFFSLLPRLFIVLTFAAAAFGISAWLTDRQCNPNCISSLTVLLQQQPMQHVCW